MNKPLNNVYQLQVAFISVGYVIVDKQIKYSRTPLIRTLVTGLPIIRIALAVRVNLSTILQN